MASSDDKIIGAIWTLFGCGLLVVAAIVGLVATVWKVWAP